MPLNEDFVDPVDCRRLWVAVLAQGIQDCAKANNFGWLASDDFKMIAGAAGVDFGTIRESVLADPAALERIARACRGYRCNASARLRWRRGPG